MLPDILRLVLYQLTCKSNNDLSIILRIAITLYNNSGIILFTTSSDN